jgi:uncharacterized membrane protein YdjX (TVP38/TMEM64 family)
MHALTQITRRLSSDTYRIHTRAVAVVALSALLTAAWYWALPAPWLSWQSLLDHLQHLGDRRLAPLWIAAIYIVGGLVVLPLSLLIIATAAAYGVARGMTYALFGAVSSAVVTFAIGRVVGEPAVRRLLGPRFETVRRQLGSCTVMSLTAVRLLPVAPFTVVNLLAGTGGVRFVPFVVGTLFGVAPGIAALGLMASGVVSQSAGAIASIGFGLAILAVLAIARRRFVPGDASSRSVSDSNAVPALPESDPE